MPQNLELEDVIAWGLGAVDLMCVAAGAAAGWWLFEFLPGDLDIRIGVAIPPAVVAAYFASGREQPGYLVPGTILSLVGLVFLGITLTGASYDYIGKFWPIFLIIAGVLLLVGPRLWWTERHN